MVFFFQISVKNEIILEQIQYNGKFNQWVLHPNPHPLETGSATGTGQGLMFQGKKFDKSFELCLWTFFIIWLQYSTCALMSTKWARFSSNDQALYRHQNLCLTWQRVTHVMVNWPVSKKVSADSGVTWLYRRFMYTTYCADMFFFKLPAEQLLVLACMVLTDCRLRTKISHWMTSCTWMLKITSRVLLLYSF